MSKKSTSKTVTTPTNPQWVTDSTKSLSDSIMSLARTGPDYGGYVEANPDLMAHWNALDPGSRTALGSLETFGRTHYDQFGRGEGRSLPELTANRYVAGANPLQTLAGERAAGLGSDEWFETLMAMPAPTVQPASLLDNLERYMSPYTKDVVDAALADYDADAARAQAQADLDIQNSGGFGGSGAWLAKTDLTDRLARARATTSSGLRDQGFTRGAALAGQDAERRQQASVSNAQLGLQHQQLLADLGFRREASDREDIATQLATGGTLRDIESAQARAPLDLVQWAAAANSGLPLQLFHGENSTTKTKSSDPLGSLISIAGLFGAPFTGGLSMFGAKAAAGLGGPAASLAGGLSGVDVDDLGGAIGAITSGRNY